MMIPQYYAGVDGPYSCVQVLSLPPKKPISKCILDSKAYILETKIQFSDIIV